MTVILFGMYNSTAVVIVSCVYMIDFLDAIFQLFFCLVLSNCVCWRVGYEDVPDFFQHLLNFIKQKRGVNVGTRQNFVSDWVRYLLWCLFLRQCVLLVQILSALSTCYAFCIVHFRPVGKGSHICLHGALRVLWVRIFLPPLWKCGLRLVAFL